MKWISIKEKKPENNQRVLVFAEYIDIKIYESNIFYDGESYCYCPVGKLENVTYWMPLPLPPEEE